MLCWTIFSELYVSNRKATSCDSIHATIRSMKVTLLCTQDKMYVHQYHVLQIVWGGKVLQFQESIHGWMVVLYGQSLLHRLFHWKSFTLTNWSTKSFHLEQFAICSTNITLLKIFYLAICIVLNYVCSTYHGYLYGITYLALLGYYEVFNSKN